MLREQGVGVLILEHYQSTEALQLHQCVHVDLVNINAHFHENNAVYGARESAGYSLVDCEKDTKRTNIKTVGSIRLCLHSL